jgi:hypothetical protein
MEDLYAIKNFGVKASELRQSIIIEKFYPTLLWRHYTGGIDGITEDLLDLNRWSTGLA